MCPLNYLQYLKRSKQHPSTRCPSRLGVTLNLEALEDRWLPNGTIPTTSPPPPSFNQAASQLFTDGVYLGKGWVNQTFLHFDPKTAYAVPLADLNADIAFNSPFVGPLAPMFVLAGEIVGAQMQYATQYQILVVEEF